MTGYIFAAVSINKKHKPDYTSLNYKTRRILRKIRNWLLFIGSSFILLCAVLFIFQEKILFSPQKLFAKYEFSFEQPFQEVTINTKDKFPLKNIIFRVENSKGLIFFLHGNGGSVSNWGKSAKTYLDLGYDVFMMDYRGYGKSQGRIRSEEQFHDDIQTVYNFIKKHYSEEKIIVLGYSLGTASAAKLASVNHPKLLILQAPYYSMTDLMEKKYPFLPPFLLRYKFETFRYIKKCKMPIVMFHGNQDQVVYYGSSLKLYPNLKPNDRLITLKGLGHNGMSRNEEYISKLSSILKRHE